MSDCDCRQTSAETTAERRTLTFALVLNATMFVVGMVAGLAAESTGLIADALDMLSDATAYGIGLVAVGRTRRFKSGAATLSGSLLMLLGLLLLADIVRRAIVGSAPEGQWMMGIACVSLVVNTVVLKLLSRFRKGEVHLRATWIFTRADVIANLGVIASGAVVAVTGWRYPDLVIGAAIGVYIIKEALEILREARESRTAVTD
jgi:cation diffusion facilitator family transporter